LVYRIKKPTTSSKTILSIYRFATALTIQYFFAFWQLLLIWQLLLNIRTRLPRYSTTKKEASNKKI